MEPSLLEFDLARRDFTVNACSRAAAQCSGASTIDAGAAAGSPWWPSPLGSPSTGFLADGVADDPTRVLVLLVMGPLGFFLAPQAANQIKDTLLVWPWNWHIGDPPEQAPPALATRCAWSSSFF